MAFNQWKILNMFKHSISKFTNDKSISNISKEFLQLVQKYTPLFSKDAADILNAQQEKRKQTSLKITSRSKDVIERGAIKEESQLPAVFGELKTKISVVKESDSKQLIPKWKQKAKPSDDHILLKLDYILRAIEGASVVESYLLSIEQLIEHVKKFPEIKSKAVKCGAIRLLLKTRSKVKDNHVQGALREALTILGYTDPVPKMGIRILAIDGGGIRGLLVLEMLKKLEEMTGKRAFELFDFFCGVSTGAILAFSIGAHQRSLDEISHRYEAISKEVFKQSSWKGTGSLVWSHSYYDTSLWERKLQEHLGKMSLISTSRDHKCPKLCAVSAIVNQERLSAFLFRNYSLPWKVQSHYMGSYDSEVWQAARASAAAPTYFEEFKLGQFLHQDGGILVNNPTAIALHEVRLLWPNTPIQCVVSFGTGRTVPSPVELTRTSEIPQTSPTATSWTNKFFKILDSATDTEAVHIMLNDLLPDHVYYRFNPYLTELISMVETDAQKLEQLRRDAIMYLRRNEEKFQEVAKTLMTDKSSTQKVMDFVKVQRDKMGF